MTAQLLFRRTLLRTILVAMLCAAALLALNPGFGLAKRMPVAQAASLVPCVTYTWSIAQAHINGFWDAAYEVHGVTSCNGSAPRGEGWVAPCSGVDVTANMDSWLSQTTARGGTRLAESGRTGLITWPGDCQWHRQVVVYGWGQVFTNPLWACLWTYDQTANATFNYLCTQDY